MEPGYRWIGQGRELLCYARNRGWVAWAIFCVLWLPAHAATSAPAADELGRLNPRATITGFLESCQNQDYQKASQYLDLRQLSLTARSKKGSDLAKKLEAILNSDARFNVLHLSRNPEGDLADDSDPNREHVATIREDGQNLVLDLERVSLQDGGPQVWLFSRDTVAAIPSIHTTSRAPIEKHLPPFLVSIQVLDTPLWKWLGLTLLAFVLLSFSRLLDTLLALFVKAREKRANRQSVTSWLEPLIQPFRVMLWLAVFRIGVGIIDPSAIARLYVGRGMEIILAFSVAWCMIRLIGLFINRLDVRLDASQKQASRAMLRLAHRTANVMTIALAIVVVLQNWGYNTSTVIAGLGVGGIAVALAAQQTIANVFGGVSLIGDHPIRIGEFGKFGETLGVVEDIGMRSTRVRTLNRTLVSVPNSSFAALNLENYSVRDKILFNPTFQIKRSTTDQQIHTLVGELNKLFSNNAGLEPAPTPAGLVGLASGSFSLEIFCYVKTSDINDFYRAQGDLLLRINDILQTLKIELA